MARERIGHRGHAARTIVIIAAASLGLSGCASLEDIPQGFSERPKGVSYTGLQATTVKAQLAVADKLAVVFQNARDDNLHYSFWSNIALVPLAVGAAATVAFSAGKTAIAAVGIGSGALIGLNSFVNGRGNAKAYQAGLGALRCEIINLRPYAEMPVPDSVAVWTEVHKGTTLLDVSDLHSTKDAKEIGDLLVAVQDLKQAVADGNKAIADAAAAAKLRDQLVVFTENATRSIEQAVAAKISQSDIDYAKLAGGLTPAAPAAAATGTAGAAGGTTPSTNAAAGRLFNPKAGTLVMPANMKAAAKGKTPPKPLDPEAGKELVATRTAEIKALTDAIKGKTAELTGRLSDYQLAAAETAVTACVKAI